MPMCVAQKEHITAVIQQAIHRSDIGSSKTSTDLGKTMRRYTGGALTAE